MYQDMDASGWGQPELPPSDPVKDAIMKEQLLKEISTSREDLSTMLAKIKSVQAEIDKLSSGNEMLQMYIDNLTKQMAAQRR